VNRTVERLDAATEHLPEVLHALSTFGGLFTNSQLLLAVALCFLGLWKISGKTAGYLIVTAGMCSAHAICSDSLTIWEGFSYLLYLAHIPERLMATGGYCISNFNELPRLRKPIFFVVIGLGIVCLYIIRRTGLDLLDVPLRIRR